MDEDAMLLGIALRQALHTFPERDRAVLLIYFQLEQPEDYAGCWPPTYASVGAYVGMKLTGEPFTEGAVRYRVEVALKKLRELL